MSPTPPTPNTEPSTPQRLRYPAAARYLGLKETTLRGLVSDRRVPHIRLSPRLVVFDVAELDRWLRERAVRA